VIADQLCEDHGQLTVASTLAAIRSESPLVAAAWSFGGRQQLIPPAYAADPDMAGSARSGGHSPILAKSPWLGRRPSRTSRGSGRLPKERGSSKKVRGKADDPDEVEADARANASEQQATVPLSYTIEPSKSVRPAHPS
jgi:hypothetical protein